MKFISIDHHELVHVRAHRPQQLYRQRAADAVRVGNASDTGDAQKRARETQIIQQLRISRGSNKVDPVRGHRRSS